MQEKLDVGVDAGPSCDPGQPKWSSVFAITLTVAGLITAEFLPVSLLTPMADGLDITEGLAGQAITATAVGAVLSSVSVERASRSCDRKTLVLLSSFLLCLSSLLVAMAPSFPLLAMGRFLLGVALGGFWAMTPALMIRLVPAERVPQALSIVYSGVAIALVVAPPMGSYLGQLMGWRGIFVVTAAFGALCLAWQLYALPKIPAKPVKNSTGVWKVSQRPGVPSAMLAIFLSFGGHFALFTYMRPYVEQVAHYSSSAFSVVLLLFGVSNFAGTLVSRRVVGRHLSASLVLAPVAMSIAALGLAAFGAGYAPTVGLALVWAAAFALVPVGWSSWITLHVADDAESAGGLQVAAIQLASAVGAGGGRTGHASPGCARTIPLWRNAFGFRCRCCALRRTAPQTRREAPRADALLNAGAS